MVLLTICTAAARADSTHSLVYHADTRFVAGEVWYNSGYSAIHDHGNTSVPQNSFTIKDRSCGDGWSTGVEWELDGVTHTEKLAGDCGPVERTFQAEPLRSIATQFRWRGFKWDTNGISATTFEPWKDDWIGASHVCGGSPDYIDWVATYGDEAGKLGLTFTITAKPTRAGLAKAGLRAPVDDMWAQVLTCTPLPTSLTAGQLTSLKQQLWCHARFANVKDAGPTWDLEAKRGPLKSLSVSKAILKGCNW
ncbi:DUF2599 domain-containing protein [Frankia sp. AiPa1]|uniref:DUF2599 domain-containing protein n=1 Tax=Frankia sp. AiPa1 TaxID=573492 RepID=UPI00202B095B|nr:DUF2599 domain-containing protein [Frankia sp. AiPa1]MCL9760885.1 DUF2599 domain-containing protein [Frankia sp. AiPa1]